ncbi:hypothetical protein H8M03_02745 [Sphingomonas sabuli]|uniref:Uncharacterized protein n=1 Tax=Sphingomonas sabuli TaxID=2764186 RepID=A0A7G9L3T1_9SPHN|nr:hypothetical protein [Sphingomonas sabuli]QNM83280.1 hypothetical protein H8M03_02745 [Sphingomonas sabuli]
MNSEPKPFASLSSGLLARKGAARPAMRPQGFGQVGAGLEDLGWNDMGFEPPKPADPVERDVDQDAFGEVVPAHPHNLAGLTPVQSPVHDQQAEIAGRLSTYSPDDAGEEDLDETAELYDPDAEEAEAEAEEVVEAFEPVEEAPAPLVLAKKPEPVTVVRTAPAPAPAPRRAPKVRSAPGAKGKAAFTLRLDRERHLKLRMACALDGRSAQQFVTQALDSLLESMPELDAMVAKANRKG